VEQRSAGIFDLTMNNFQEWITLRLKLDSAGEAMQFVAETVHALASVDWMHEQASEEIRKIRQQRLAIIQKQSAAQNPEGREDREEWQIARIYISVLCDLHGQGWSFRVVDGQVQVLKPTPK
jgi:hypothetical protein